MLIHETIARRSPSVVASTSLNVVSFSSFRACRHIGRFKPKSKFGRPPHYSLAIAENASLSYQCQKFIQCFY